MATDRTPAPDDRPDLTGRPARPGPSAADGERHVSRRVEVDEESVRQSLAGLVLTIVELLRQLMERQALRRIDQGGLSDEQIEKLGLTLMALEENMTELRERFGLTEEDLNLDLGPLGPLLPRD
ncbi:gas vesicle protein K [Streptomyces sp. NA02950]|uniref:gas vesicle protein K n=1 Tax=Streptomyces sp. NA02950 TaxID=2742137 RepID=UPI0020CB1F6F|nr:gas vesicle protein K [Streptomyces sp. NA02950]